jgi:hypothetical protein
VTPTTYIAAGERTAPRFGRAFAAGCGGRSVVMPPMKALRPGPVAMFGSPQLWALLQKAIGLGRDWLYGDHGYFGRGLYFRITRNAYQCDGTGAGSSARFRLHERPVQRWRRDGANILVCPTSPGHCQLHGMDVHAWLAWVNANLRQHSDRPIVVRWKTDERPIARDLQKAHAVVAWSSAAAIDALIAGVPVFVLAEHSAAYRMGTPDLSRIERPVYPDDRQEFCEVLAANQWTLDEIAAGVAWKALQARKEAGHAAA